LLGEAVSTIPRFFTISSQPASIRPLWVSHIKALKG
jgi:hypothetical protein